MQPRRARPSPVALPRSFFEQATTREATVAEKQKPSDDVRRKPRSPSEILDGLAALADPATSKSDETPGATVREMLFGECGLYEDLADFAARRDEFDARFGTQQATPLARFAASSGHGALARWCEFVAGAARERKGEVQRAHARVSAAHEAQRVRAARPVANEFPDRAAVERGWVQHARAVRNERWQPGRAEANLFAACDRFRRSIDSAMHGFLVADDGQRPDEPWIREQVRIEAAQQEQRAKTDRERHEVEARGMAEGLGDAEGRIVDALLKSSPLRTAALDNVVKAQRGANRAAARAKEALRRLRDKVPPLVEQPRDPKGKPLHGQWKLTTFGERVGEQRKRRG